MEDPQIFTRPPKETATQSWLIVLVVSVLIFLIAPFGRILRDVVSGTWGAHSFLYGAGGVVVLLMVWGLVAIRRSARHGVPGIVVIALTGGIYGALIYGARGGSPVEAVHYVLYGVLGLLLFRAYVHHVRDYSIYALVLIAGTMIGLMDEIIQWVAPDRHFDTRDIWMNLTGVALVQIAIAFGVRPPLVADWPDRWALGRVCHTAAVLTGMLFLCHLNTPAAVSAYVKPLPFLDFLTTQDDAMIEYGHLHAAPGGGSFKSRLTLGGLHDADAAFADRPPPGAFEARTWEGFQSFIQTHPAHLYPALHEARVHIRSRDVNRKRAKTTISPDRAQRHATFALQEHRILAQFFPRLYAASIHFWPPSEAETMAAQALKGLTRQSKVSAHLITAYTRSQALWFLGLLTPLLAFTGYRCRRQR